MYCAFIFDKGINFFNRHGRFKRRGIYDMIIITFDELPTTKLYERPDNRL